MTSADVERLRRGTTLSRERGFTCAICDLAPTCPQLHDELWVLAWIAALPLLRHPRCTCGEHPIGPSHSATCELNRGPRRLLCLACVEVILERRITVLDLMPCLGSLQLVEMAGRLA